MESDAAKEYHTFLHKKLHQTKWSLGDAMWVPLLGTLAFFTFESYYAAAFGIALGWGITAVLVRINKTKQLFVSMELVRHLHEHTEEAEAGKTMAAIQLAVEESAKKWW